MITKYQHAVDIDINIAHRDELAPAGGLLTAMEAHALEKLDAAIADLVVIQKRIDAPPQRGCCVRHVGFCGGTIATGCCDGESPEACAQAGAAHEQRAVDTLADSALRRHYEAQLLLRHAAACRAFGDTALVTVWPARRWEEVMGTGLVYAGRVRTAREALLRATQRTNRDREQLIAVGPGTGITYTAWRW